MPVLSTASQTPNSPNPPTRQLQMALLLPLPTAAAALLPRTTAAASGGYRRSSRPAARAAVKDLSPALAPATATGTTIGVTNPIKDADLSVLLSIPLFGVSSSPSREELWQPEKQEQPEGDGGDDDRRKYYLNLGYAIRTLREELPEIFYREPTFDIYRDDIVFKDRLNTFAGIENYKRIFRALRFNGRIFFKALWVDIVSVWQPADNVIMIRWIVHGIPRVPWEARGRFDGNSEYKLDKNGKIYEHRVDNVVLNSPTKFRVLAVEELMQSLGCPSTPKPTYFETTLSGVVSCMPFMLRFSWVRYYLAFHLILAMWSAPKG